MSAKYINPYTDFGFKKLFGEEANKDLLTDFLNTLLPQKHQIVTLTFRNPDILGESASDRRAVFDIYCENSLHEPFIVEMQKAEQEYFKDRSVYYVAHPIREQAQKGKEWNYQQRTVYFIGILDFLYDKDTSDPILIREVSLKDQVGVEFYDKLQLIYIQMPLFDKSESELVTRQDKWLYFLKNLPSLEHIPQVFKEEVFKKAFHTAEVSAMGDDERTAYEQNLNDYWTYFATIRTAEKKGIDKGRTEERLAIARNLKNMGLDTASIAQATGLSIEEVSQ